MADTKVERTLEKIKTAHEKAKKREREANAARRTRDELMLDLVDNHEVKPGVIAEVLDITPEKVGQALRRLRDELTPF